MLVENGEVVDGVQRSLCPIAVSRVNVQASSETGPLKTVVMRLASRYRISLSLLASTATRSGWEQLRHNRWRAYDHRRVRAQQERFIEVLHQYGVSVVLLEGIIETNSQIYTRDIAFAIDDLLFVSRMGSRHREPEQVALAGLLRDVPQVVHLQQGRIEGGDVMLHDNRVLLGLGEATTQDGVVELRRELAARGSLREVVPIPFAQRGVIHLGTKFNIVSDHAALFYRPAFDVQTLHWFERDFDLIEVTSDEVRGLQVNTFALGEGKVVMQHTSQRLAGLLEDRGLTPILMNYSEVVKWPGSFRCATLPLARAG